MFKKIFDRVSRFIDENKISGIIIAALSFITVFFFSLTEVYDIFELKLYDLRFKIKPPISEWERLTFVDINELSLLNVGEFPWPRNLYAKGFKSLKAVGASQVTLDIMFPDKSPINLDDKAYRKLLGRKGKIGAEEIKSAAIDNDSLFSKGIADFGNVILSYTFDHDDLSPEKAKVQNTPEFKKAVKRFMERASIPVPKERIKEFQKFDDPRIRRISYPIPELMNSANNFGFVHRDTDMDGVIRKIRLYQVFQGRIFFNLAMAMYIDLCNVPLNNVDIYPGDRIVLKKAFNPRNQNIEDVSIPIDREGIIHINWAGPGPREKSFNIMPFYSLLDYGDYAPLVQRFFDDKDEKNGKFELEKLNEKLGKEITAYNSVKNPAERPGIWKDISKTKKEINRVKLSYYNELRDAVDKKKKELDKKEDKKLREEFDVLQDDLRAIDLVIRVENLADSIILTGLTATGTHDIGVIPVSKEYARVGIYHNVVNTIFSEKYITKAGHFINYLIMLFAALSLGLVIQRMNARMSIITILASFVLCNLIIILLFVLFNVWVDQLGVILSLLLPSITISGVKFLKEESQKRFIKSAFSRYLTPGVIDQIIKNPESLELGGEDKKITIFFSDIAGFSTISEKLTAHDLVVRLNEYLTEMTDIILKYGGTVDKYIGDAIMAFYGAPYQMEDNALQACLAAIDMKKRLRELQEEWRNRGVDVLSARMGINSGTATVGNMGSKSRLDYTAMGDSVNLASRLEGANKYYSTSAMISESTYEGARDEIEVRRLDKIRVVGKAEAVVIYELLGRKGALPDKFHDMRDKYNLGMDSFAEREWKRAKSLFNEALKIIPDDGPSQKYVERCNEFMKKPPSKNWDGVYGMKAK